MANEDTSKNVEGLTVVAETSSMIWNAVAVEADRIFVAGPRWTGMNGPAVAFLDNGRYLRPYPDAAWNSWRDDRQALSAFVNVNAIHCDRQGHMWVVDTGSPLFGGDPIPDGAKVVCIDLRSDRVKQTYAFSHDVALPGSYIDDIRISGDHAYLTDAGRPGLIVLHLRTGQARRLLDGHPSVTAPRSRPIVMEGGAIVLAPDGSPLRVHSDPLELSPDGRFLYFGSLHGPWSRIETRFLNDATLMPGDVGQQVAPWADLPPVGGAVMDVDGSLYFTDLACNAVRRRKPDGAIETVVQDVRLHWVDAPVISDDWIWLPVPQMDRVALFNKGVSKVEWPIRLYRFKLNRDIG